MIFVIDDDALLCQALVLILEQPGRDVITFHSAEDFLKQKLPDCPCCAVVDMDLPGMSGLELQALVAQNNMILPFIFLTGLDDVSSSVKALKSGANDYLVKPVTEIQLVDAVHSALVKSAQLREAFEQQQQAQQRLQHLTKREEEVMLMAVNGYADKEIARCLNISHRTVEKHKSSLLQKTESKKLIDLVTLAIECGLLPFPAHNKKSSPLNFHIHQ